MGHGPGGDGPFQVGGIREVGERGQGVVGREGSRELQGAVLAGAGLGGFVDVADQEPGGVVVPTGRWTVAAARRDRRWRVRSSGRVGKETAATIEAGSPSGSSEYSMPEPVARSRRTMSNGSKGREGFSRAWGGLGDPQDHQQEPDFAGGTRVGARG